MAEILKATLQIAHLKTNYAKRTLTPAEVVNLVYDGVRKYHDKAVWIYLTPQQEALSRAADLLEAFPDPEQRPPLFGIPFSVKDSIDVAGLPTTLACPSFAYTADATATVVEKILQAGGILIGKTNLDQFATGLTGTRSPYGAPRCVFDSDYISGGSSSGSAVSIAASLVSFSICTDTGGSTRVPAALNGVVGLKPTLGCISTTGLFPACKNIDCVCVMANTVDDAETVYHVAKGFDSKDTYARRQLPSWPSWRDPIRFGTPGGEALQSLSQTYTDLFKDFLTVFARSPLFNEATFDYSPFEKANQMLYDSSIVAQRLLAFRPYTSSHGYDQLHPTIKATFETAEGNAFDAVKTYEDVFMLAQHKRDAEEEFKKIDILIVPAITCHWTVEEIEADPLGRNKVMGKFTNFVNLLDLCAISVPVRTWLSVNGKTMSFGVTIIAQAGKDREVMNVGRKIMDMSLS